MQIERSTYFIPTTQTKRNGEKLSDKDLINIGYMAGRFGINLNKNPHEPNKPVFVDSGVLFNINSCTSGFFEKNLDNLGINFNYLA